MHVHFLDPFRAKNSPIHRLDSRIKLVLVLGFILCTSLTPTGAWPVYILLYSLILMVEVLSDLGIGLYTQRALLAVPFILAALPLMFTVPGSPLFSFSFAGWVLTATVTGVERFASIAFKSWISVQAGIVLATTTEFPDLLLAMRAVRIPRLLVSIFSLMWRYLFVMADEAIRLMRARQARSGASETPNLKTGRNVAWRAKITGGLAGSLFLRAFERSDRIYMAMLARGYDGDVRSTSLPKISRGSWLVLLAGLLVFTALLVFSQLVWS